MAIGAYVLSVYGESVCQNGRLSSSCTPATTEAANESSSYGRPVSGQIVVVPPVRPMKPTPILPVFPEKADPSLVVTPRLTRVRLKQIVEGLVAVTSQAPVRARISCPTKKQSFNIPFRPDAKPSNYKITPGVPAHRPGK